MTEPDKEQSVFDEIAALLPAGQREHYYRRIAHLRKLSPDDELLQIVEAMGFLSLLIRETPTHVSSEREKLEAILQEAISAFRVALETTAAYRDELDRRVGELPAALALNPKNVAAHLSETLRQQFQETGIPGLAESLSSHGQILRKMVGEFSHLLDTISDREYGTVAQVQTAFTTMQADLDNAASHLRVVGDALIKDLHRALTVVSAGALILGFFIGVLYIKWIGP